MKIDASIIISISALLVSVWQGYLAKKSLEQAENTKKDTADLLAEIKEKVSKVETISDETRKDVKEQIGKLIDQQNDHFRTLINAPKENNQNEMMMKLMPELIKSPDLLKLFMDAGKKQ